MAEADEKTRFAKRRGARIGSLEPRSITTKKTPATRPTTSNVTDFQPSHASDVPPSDVKRISPDAELVNTMMPAESAPGCTRAPAPGTPAAVTINAAMPNGRLTKKIQRHEKYSTMNPPRSGPMTVAAPNVAPKNPA